MRLDVQLPGPPLAEWLVFALGKARVAVWSGPGAGRGASGRVVGATVGALGKRLAWSPLGPTDPPGSLDGLVAVVALGEPAEPPALTALRPGGWVIELGHPPAAPLWRPRLWLRRRRALRGAAESRAGAWLARGCYAVEQWAPIDVPQALVTCGRVRAIPAA